METTLILSVVCLLIGVCGFCIAVWSIYNTCRRQGNKGTVKIGHMKLQDNLCWKLDLEDKDTRNAVLEKIQRYQPHISDIARIKRSDKTHVANYTKYRYTGSDKRDVDVWHSPTNTWVGYYLMFNTPFEDSGIRYNGEDVTSGGNSATTTQQEASESTFSRSQYDGSGETTSCYTTRSSSYYEGGYSSSSSSDSYSDSGSSSD